MAKPEYIIVIVDTNPKRFPPAKTLVKSLGIPPAVAAAYAKERRKMSPSGLKRRRHEDRN